MNSAISALQRRASTLFLVSTTAILCVAATRASASPFAVIIGQEDTSGHGGTILDKGGLHLVGYGIPVAEFYEYPADRFYDITGNCGGLGCLEFDTQGDLVIFGSVPALSIGPSPLFGSDLSFPVHIIDSSSSIQLEFNGEGGRMAPALLDAFDLSPDLEFPLFYFQNAFLVRSHPDGSLEYKGAGMFLETGSLYAPEPGSLLLLATGLALLAGMRSRTHVTGSTR